MRPIPPVVRLRRLGCDCGSQARSRLWRDCAPSACPDRKSTRLNFSHLGISYAVFCLKKNSNEALPILRRDATTAYNTLQSRAWWPAAAIREYHAAVEVCGATAPTAPGATTGSHGFHD